MKYIAIKIIEYILMFLIGQKIGLGIPSIKGGKNEKTFSGCRYARGLC